MKTAFLIFLVAIYTISCVDQKSNKPSESSSPEGKTVFYFIRHAEKDRSNPENQDPHLNSAGLERAQKWKEELKEVNFDVIYTTDFNRTRETAGPLANHNDLELSLYDPAIMNDPNFVKENSGKTVLIVGHSNTTPMFVNAILGEEKYPHMDDDNNADLYIVTIENGKISDELRKVN